MICKEEVFIERNHKTERNGDVTANTGYLLLAGNSCQVPETCDEQMMIINVIFLAEISHV